MLTQAWVCRTPGEAGADGTCQACGAFGRGNNPDVLAVRPTGPSSIIRAEAIRNERPGEEDPIPVTMFLRTAPLMSRNKVVIVEQAHRMNQSASSGLLKTLEEPQGYGKLVLTSESIGAIAPTILSRCLCVACELPETSGAETRSAGEAAIEAFARELPGRRWEDALIVADQFLGLCDAFEKEVGRARGANAMGLEVLARALLREERCPPEWAQAAIETHRRILGNANAQLVVDALFIRMLRPR